MPMLWLRMFLPVEDMSVTDISTIMEPIQSPTSPIIA